MKKFKNKLFIIATIASLFGLCGNIQTHAMEINNNSIEEKNDFLGKKRNKANTEDSKNDNYFYNKFPFNSNLNNNFYYKKPYEFKPYEFTKYSKNNNYFNDNYFYNKFPLNDNLNNSFDEEKSDEFKPDEFTEDLKNDIYFYNKFPFNSNLNNNSANNEQNENVSNNENIITPYNYDSLKKDLGETIKECKGFFKVCKDGELNFNYSTLYTYIIKMRDEALRITKTKYPNITNKIFNEIFNEILIEVIREKHKDDKNYIFNFTIQNVNGNYIGVTQNDKDKIQTIISTLTKDIKTLSQSSIPHCKNGVKYLLMANTKIQKSDNKTDCLDEDTAVKFVDFLLNRIKNVSNNENIITPDEYNSLKEDLGKTIKKCKKFFQVFEEEKLKGELNCNYSTMYQYIRGMRKDALPTIRTTKYPNIANQIFYEILMEAIREKHKDNENYIFNFTIQNVNGSYVGVTQNDKNKIQNVISHLTKDIKTTISQNSISYYKKGVKYLLMADTKIQKSDNKTDYLNEDTANKFADFLLDKIKNVNNKSNNSANNEQNENVSNNENIITPDEYNSLKEDLSETINECKKFFKVFKNGKLIYNYSTLYKYIIKMRDEALPTIKTKYPNIANQIFDKILIEAIREGHKDNENYIFNCTIQNDNENYVGVTQNDKDKIQTIISTLTNAIKALNQSSISGYRNGVKYLLMADTKIQKSDNKTDYLDEDTADKFAKQLIDKAKS